jgi:hypothetical protein
MMSNHSIESLDSSDPTQVTLSSVALPSAILEIHRTQYTESEAFRMTDSNGRSFFFAVTDPPPGPTHRMDDSHRNETKRISESDILVQTQYTESEAFGMTDSNGRSFFFAVTDPPPGPTHRIDDSHSGETQRIVESDILLRTEVTLLSVTPPSVVSATDPVATVLGEPFPLGLPDPNSVGEESALGGGVLAGIGAGVVIVIIGVIVWICFVFAHRRSDREHSESIKENDGELQSTDVYDQGDDDHEYENVLSADAHSSQRTEEVEEGTFHSRESGHEYENVLSNEAPNGQQRVGRDLMADDRHEGVVGSSHL